MNVWTKWMNGPREGTSLLLLQFNVFKPFQSTFGKYNLTKINPLGLHFMLQPTSQVVIKLPMKETLHLQHYTEHCSTKTLNWFDLPGCDVTRRVLLSSVWTGFLKPHKASTSCNSMDMMRSSPFLMTTATTTWASRWTAATAATIYYCRFICVYIQT